MNGAVAEEALQHGDGLGQALDARRDRLEREPDRVVFGAVPAGPDPDVEAPATEHVEAGHVLGQDRRMAQVVVDHERPDPEGLRGGRDDRHGRDRRELLDQVIRDDDRREADRFGTAGGLCQRGRIDDGLEAGQETERSRGSIHALDGSRGRTRRGFQRSGGTVVT